MLVLDGSVDRLIEKRVKNFSVETARPPKGLTDENVLKFAVKRESPIITRDQGDFVILDTDVNHYGIMIDKFMHLRNRTLVAETVGRIVKDYPELLRNNLVFLSSFYGQF